MSQGKAFAYAWIQQVADELLEILDPACVQIEVAGSIRRKRAWCHDIDLVAFPFYTQLGQVDLFNNRINSAFEARELEEAISRALGSRFRIKPNAKVVEFVYRDVPVGIYLAEPGSGENYWALLQMRTGPRDFNVKLAALAKDLGYEYRAGYGIYQCDRRVDDGTEGGILRVLGLPWVEPAHRDKFTMKASRHAA